MHPFRMPLGLPLKLSRSMYQRLAGIARPEQVGQPPGTLVYVGPDKSFASSVLHAAYSPTRYEENEMPAAGASLPAPDAADAASAPDGHALTHLVLVRGVHDADAVARLGERFGIHHLAVEDVLNTTVRPKAEELDDGKVILVLKHLEAVEDDALVTEQVSLVLAGDTVLAFQESDKDLFGPVLSRLRKCSGLQFFGHSFGLIRPPRKPGRSAPF